MPATGLKPPPASVKNEWAWTYTLNKLRDKGMVDEFGNPTNYAAAMAIYKRVVVKYGGDISKIPEVKPMEELAQQPRAVILAMDVGTWLVSRGFAWGANEDVTARMYLQAVFRMSRVSGTDQPVVLPLFSWRCEVYGAEAGVIKHDYAIQWESALWLVRNSPTALQWARSRMEEALGDLDEAVAEVDTDMGEVGGVRYQSNFLDHRGTKRALQDMQAHIEEALAV